MSKQLNNDSYDYSSEESQALSLVMSVLDSSKVNIASNYRLQNGGKTIGVIVVTKSMLTAGQSHNHACLLIAKGFHESEEDFIARVESVGIGREELVERPTKK